jgi:solute carrier family 35 protein E3
MKTSSSNADSSFSVTGGSLLPHPPPPLPSYSASSWEAWVNIINVLAMLLNVVAVVGCVAFTKIVFLPPYNFTFINAISSMHFFYTSAMGYFCQRLYMFQPKAVPIVEYVKVGATQVGAVCLINLSLYYNSIGMYQVLKFGNIAVICVIEYLWLGQYYSFATYLSIGGLLLGIYMTTVTEIKFSLIGFICGALGATCAAFHQILTKNIQQVYDVSAIQLLQPQALYAGVFAVVASVCIDDITALASYEWSSKAVWLIFLGCNCAFLLNFSCYLVIGRTSPITYGVAGNLKTTGTLLFGYLILKQKCTLRNLVGIILSNACSVWYACLRMQVSKKPAASSSETNNEESGVDSDV